MTDSIKEQIVKNVITALEGILISAGYENTILSVQRHMPAGNTFSLVPMLGVEVGNDKKIKTSDPYILKQFELFVTVMTRIDTTTNPNLSVDEKLNSLEADVEKALTSSPSVRQRGGNADDTEYSLTGPYIPAEGMPDFGRTMVFLVDYRHKQGDPYSL